MGKGEFHLRLDPCNNAIRQARFNARGRAAFVRSLDPASSKEQAWDERELGQKWSKAHWSEAMDLKLAPIQAEQQRGPDRNYGPTR